MDTKIKHRIEDLQKQIQTLTLKSEIKDLRLQMRHKRAQEQRLILEARETSHPVEQAELRQKAANLRWERLVWDRPRARWMHLAYAFLRGRPYDLVEPHVVETKTLTRSAVSGITKVLGDEHRDQIKAWLGGRCEGYLLKNPAEVKTAKAA